MLNIYRYETDREALKKQLERSVTFEPEVERTVHDILAAVRSGGDKALLDYTERFLGGQASGNDGFRRRDQESL